MLGAVALTGAVLTGSIKSGVTTAYADFDNCGQSIRVGGDVKLRGVLVGRIGSIERTGPDGDCQIGMDLFPEQVEEIPDNSGAQVRAKTVFGEKWVEMLYPDSPSGVSIAAGDIIPKDRTIDPLEVETILNTGLPILNAIDPENLSAALDALATGFVGHEDAIIRGIQRGSEALAPFNENKGLFRKGLRQLKESGEVFDEIDEDLFAALANLDSVNRFTSANSALLAENLRKAPALLGELSTVFETRFGDLTKMVDRGATVIGVLAARADDLDRLLKVLPKFNSAWIRNLKPQCRFRQASTEPGASKGDPVPGRCWRVHNLIGHSRGAYEPGDEPQPRESRPTGADFRRAGAPRLTDLSRLLYLPAAFSLIEDAP